MKTSHSNMQITFAKRWGTRPNADVVAIPFWKDSSGAILACEEDSIESLCLPHGVRTDFVGDEGQLCLLYQTSESDAAPNEKELRMILVGLGVAEEVTAERLRTTYAAVTRFCRDKKLKSINIMAPDVPELPESSLACSVAEGLLLANYAFVETKLLTRITFIGCTKAAEKVVKETIAVCEAVYEVRNLVNGNADEITPPRLAKYAQNLAKSHSSLTATVFDKKQIEKEGMGLLLAVGRGAIVDPRFIQLEYRGAPKSKERTVIVGKGITFDTGGLDIKPAASMEHQRTDMAGAAVVLGTLKAIAALGLKCNVVGIIPSAENAIGSKSFKPGDVYPSYNGMTVEIGNTDAEGRLVLADALAYAVKKLHPTRIIDIATLTGAVNVALGDEVAGLWASDDILAEDLIAAGETTYERVWRMPLVEEYRSNLKSDRADLKNVGGGGAGSIVAALFLQAFVKDVPWAHLDIAGTRYLQEGRRYRTKGATGFGVRLLVEYLKNLHTE